MAAVDGGLGFRRWRSSAVRVDEDAEEGLGGEVAGDFAGGGSAHAVADDEDTGSEEGGAGVLVVAADTAGVGEHGEER